MGLNIRIHDINVPSSFELFYKTGNTPGNMTVIENGYTKFGGTYPSSISRNYNVDPIVFTDATFNTQYWFKIQYTGVTGQENSVGYIIENIKTHQPVGHIYYALHCCDFSGGTAEFYTGCTFSGGTVVYGSNLDPTPVPTTTAAATPLPTPTPTGTTPGATPNPTATATTTPNTTSAPTATPTETIPGATPNPTPTPTPTENCVFEVSAFVATPTPTGTNEPTPTPTENCVFEITAFIATPTPTVTNEPTSTPTQSAVPGSSCIVWSESTEYGLSDGCGGTQRSQTTLTIELLNGSGNPINATETITVSFDATYSNELGTTSTTISASITPNNSSGVTTYSPQTYELGPYSGQCTPESTTRDNDTPTITGSNGGTYTVCIT